MFQRPRFTCIVLVLLIFSGNNLPAQVRQSTRRTLLNVIVAHLQSDLYGKQPAFADLGGKRSAWRVDMLDVQGQWAYVSINKRTDKRAAKVAEYLVPDGASFLLRRRAAKWSVVSMGTDMTGVGAKMHVPKQLWKKWYID